MLLLNTRSFVSLKVTDFSYTLKKQHHKTVTKVIFIILLYFVLVNFILSFLIFPVRQVSESMKPGIQQNSIILSSKIVPVLQRGDIVLLNSRFDTTNNIFLKAKKVFVSFFTGQQIVPGENSELPCTKNQFRRVIGMPGDTIYMRDYILYVCPEGQKHFLTEFELTQKKYSISFYAPPAEWNTAIGVAGSFEKITLGSNQYFVLGDNRKSCEDSRIWGPVTMDNVNAKALLSYFPIHNVKLY